MGGAGLLKLRCFPLSGSAPSGVLQSVSASLPDLNALWTDGDQSSRGVDQAQAVLDSSRYVCQILAPPHAQEQ